MFHIHRFIARDESVYTLYTVALTTFLCVLFFPLVVVHCVCVVVLVASSSMALCAHFFRYPAYLFFPSISQKKQQKYIVFIESGYSFCFLLCIHCTRRTSSALHWAILLFRLFSILLLQYAKIYRSTDETKRELNR